MASRMARRAALAWLSVAVIAQAATLLRQPYLQNVQTARATILWTTAEDGAAEVWYSTDRARWSSVPALTRRFGTTETGLFTAYFQHRADLFELNPGTLYYYRILVDGQDLASGDDLRFRTPASGTFNFLVFGDSGQDTQPQRDLADLMLKEVSGDAPPSLVLHVGDIAYPNGTFEQFQRTYFNYYRDMMKRIPFFTTPGNHDYNTNSAAPYLAVHAPPIDGVPAPDRGRYYSFDSGNVHFVSLDSNTPLLQASTGAGPMLQWLEQDLQRTRQTWKVVFFHHTPFPLLQHEDDGQSTLARTIVAPILDKYYVDLVFAGHEHNYQQTYPLRAGRPQDPGFGTVYITSGGGGGVLHPVIPRPEQVYAESAYHYMRVEVRGSRMVLHAIRVDGQEIDRVTMEPRFQPTGLLPQLSAGSVVNAATFTQNLSVGSLISIFGQNLAVRQGSASSLPLPRGISGTAASINGRPLPLLFVSPGQINAQLPFDVLGTATLRVTTLDGNADASVAISDVAPAIFTTSPDPAAVHASGTLVSVTSPAQSGEILSLYATGLGELDGRIEAGEPAPVPPLATKATVQLQIGNVTVGALFAGLTPGFSGLYQVNFTVPSGLAAGSQPLKLIVRGASSNEVKLAIR